jgi:hypothetical protein
MKIEEAGIVGDGRRQRAGGSRANRGRSLSRLIMREGVATLGARAINSRSRSNPREKLRRQGEGRRMCRLQQFISMRSQ